MSKLFRNMSVLQIFICSVCFSYEWFECFQKGLDEMEAHQATKAIEFFTASIKADSQHAEVYIERANAYNHLKQYELALNDLVFAQCLKNISPREYIVSMNYKAHAFANLGRMKEAVYVLNWLQDNDPSLPRADIVGDKMYYRNVPSCKCTQKMIEDALIGMGICEKEDIKKYECGIWIIQLGTRCRITTKIENEPQACLDTTLMDNTLWDDEAYCCDRCESVADICSIACIKWFPSTACQVACQSTVFIFKKTCKWCCYGGEFYKKCVKPFENIRDYVKCPHDPAWDD